MHTRGGLGKNIFIIKTTEMGNRGEGIELALSVSDKRKECKTVLGVGAAVQHVQWRDGTMGIERE